jgi:hypothetical protein
MPYYFKPLQFAPVFFRMDASLLLRDVNLLVDSIYSGQVGQQQSAAASFGHQHAVAFYI